MTKPSQDDLVNEAIRFKEVLVIHNNDQLGVMSRFDALAKAEALSLDLVCVAPKAEPPVCRIMDYGKFRFEKQKQQREARKNQKIVSIKEVQLSPVIGEHDIETKKRNAIKFLEKGDKVKVSIRFRGRQLAHIDIGQAVLDEFVSQLEEYGVVEKKGKLEGRTIQTIVAPKKK